MEHEICQLCNCVTGKAGKGDGSLYIGDNIGPLCPDCHDIVSPDFEALKNQLAAARAENERLRDVAEKARCFSTLIRKNKEQIARVLGCYWFTDELAALDAALKGGGA